MTTTLKKGLEVQFSEIWDGDGDGEQILKDGSVCVGFDSDELPIIVGFDVVSFSDDLLDAVVMINDIY